MDRKSNTPIEEQRGLGLAAGKLAFSLLLCYPELAKVCLEAQEEGVLLEFTLVTRPKDEEFEARSNKIMDCLRLYHQLEHIVANECYSYYGGKAYHIFRGWQDLSSQEINLMVTLVGENFGDCLLVNGKREFYLDVKRHLDEVDSILYRFRSEKLLESIVGLREKDDITIFVR